MLRIAVIDHHLNNFHAETFLGLLRGPLKGEGAAITTAWESDPAGEDWCAKNGVRRAATPEEAVREADAALVLAPDNVESHPALAAAVLPLGKPTFIDKLLAPTLAEAQEIAGIARRHQAPLFSSSALRYATELEAALPALSQQPVPEAFARGLGLWESYGVHTVSIALRLLGGDIHRLIDTGTPTARTVTLDYGGGRRAVLDVRTAQNEGEYFGWSFAARAGDRYVGAAITDYSGFYENLMRRVVAFFQTGRIDMPIEDALSTVAVMEGANRSMAAGGEWQSLRAL